MDCLFTGKIHGDLRSAVTVSGCVDNPETTVSIASTYLPDGVLNMIIVNGTSSILDVETDVDHDFNDALVPSSQRKKRSVTFGSNINDIALSLPDYEVTTTRSFYEGELPDNVDLETTVWYENSLLGKFDNNHTLTKEWLSRVMEFSKPLLLGIDMGINLKIIEAKYANMTLVASGNNIGALVALKHKHLNSYFCYDPVLPGTVGIAYVGSACNTNGYAVNINEYFRDTDSEISSARVYVHELGHNVGML